MLVNSKFTLYKRGLFLIQSSANFIFCDNYLLLSRKDSLENKIMHKGVEFEGGLCHEYEGCASCRYDGPAS